MRKYTAEEKIKICEEYISGKSSAKELCCKYGLSQGKPPGVFWRWIAQYRKYGDTAFIRNKGNRTYTKEIKEQAVQEYLNGDGSLLDICVKYGISSEDIVSDWIKCYNANMELKDYEPNREIYMADARRKTTLDERKEIVAYCVSHNNDYKETASKYAVSYHQVYSWVRKAQEVGEDGLKDKRGCHKRDNEVDEMERLRRENQRLKRQLEEKDMLCELLKKVRELEGM